MYDLAKALKHAGLSLPFVIPGGFETCPGDVRELARILLLPNPDLNDLHAHPNLEDNRFYRWTVEDGQGIAYAGQNRWFLSARDYLSSLVIESNHISPATVVERVVLLAQAGLAPSQFDHIGDIDYGWFCDPYPEKGLLFAPVRSVSDDRPHIIMGMNDELQVVAWADLPMFSGEASCSIHPWNNYLYVFGMRHPQYTYQLHAYDPSFFYQVLMQNTAEWGRKVEMPHISNASITLREPDGNPYKFDCPQSVSFSRNGRVYVATSPGSGPFDNWISVFSMLTGKRLCNSRKINFPGWGDEIEGIAIHPDGTLYIAVTENDVIGGDTLDLYRLYYPSMPSDAV